MKILTDKQREEWLQRMEGQRLCTGQIPVDSALDVLEKLIEYIESKIHVVVIDE